MRRSCDLALIFSGCDSDANRIAMEEGSRNAFGRKSDILYVAGSLDRKYTSIGHRLLQIYSGFSFVELPEVGHALLAESPDGVASLMANFLCNVTATVMPDTSKSAKLVFDACAVNSNENTSSSGIQQPTKSLDEYSVTPLQIDMVPFTIYLTNGSEENEERGLVGIGWRRSDSDEGPEMKQRRGILIQVSAYNSRSEEIVGVGEVSPLTGLHYETISEAEKQLTIIQNLASTADSMPSFKPRSILSLNGELKCYLDEVTALAKLDTLHPSVASGLEMALIALSSNILNIPLPQAIAASSPTSSNIDSFPMKLPINGLITIDKGYEGVGLSQSHFQSTKIKIGHEPDEDARRILHVIASQRNGSKLPRQKVRADANRAWDKNAAYSFAASIHAMNQGRYSDDAFSLLEFIEEPLAKPSNTGLVEHMQLLKEFYRSTGISFALDETVYDVVCECGGNWKKIEALMDKMFDDAQGIGCAAIVLKPTLLGIELSVRIARLVWSKFGIGAVISSSFESGVGLSYLASLAAVTDAERSTQSQATMFAHGLGTFQMLSSDILSPPFAQYVNENGEVDVLKLGQALSELSLEVVEKLPDYSKTKASPQVVSLPQTVNPRSNTMFASSSQVKGRTITLYASLSLPFSDSIACDRFTDLPQMPRWSPWLKSVEYITASETEWKLDVLGKTFTWRARSTVTADPKG